MNDQERQIIYSILIRLIDGGEVLTPMERRDLLNELCRLNCEMSLSEFLTTTENQRNIQIKRGPSDKNNEYMGLPGEITMDTDTNTIRVHDGETIGGTAVARATDIAGDWVVESQLPTADNNYTWYRKYKSGWVEMGGQSTSQTITLPIEMADTNYNIQMTGKCDKVPENNVDIHGFRDITTTGFTTQGNVLNSMGNSAAVNTAIKYWRVSGTSKF